MGCYGVGGGVRKREKGDAKMIFSGARVTFVIIRIFARHNTYTI